MLFDLGWSEILLIGTVALVFIGPKDLPKAMRVAGYWVRKARTLSREFQSSVDQMIREAELDEMRQDLKKAAEFDLDKEFHNTIDPTGSLRDSLEPPELPDFSATAPEPASAAAEVEAGTAAAAAPADHAVVQGGDGAHLAPSTSSTAGAGAEPAPPAEPETHGFTPPAP